MDSLRNPRLAALLLVFVVVAAASAALGSWLPLLGSLPWLLAIAWYGSRDAGASREFPSAAEAARERLWAR
jgi:hypothetical protein